MKARTWVEDRTADAERMKAFQQERLILEVTESISQLMEEQGVSKSELAKRLGTTKGYITQLLDGRTNMTLRTVSDVMFALGRALSVSDRPVSVSSASPSSGSEHRVFQVEEPEFGDIEIKALEKSGCVENDRDPEFGSSPTRESRMKSNHDQSRSNSSESAKTSSPEVRQAAEQYASDNPEIFLAIEAMRRSRVVSEEQVTRLLKEQPYIIGY